jgi:DNA-binding LacI/PurR family transcriptional regulator
MSPTIEEVAERSGFSTATVSRALRGLPNVAPSTRERVIRAAEDLNYVIDPYASRLATGRTMTIGIVIPLVDQWFYNKVSIIAETVLNAHGYDVLRYSITGSKSRSQLLRQIATGRRVDGLIVVTTPLDEADEELLRESGLPVVTVETVADAFPSVACDNFAAAMTATHHLVNLGHRKIAIISGLSDDPMRFPIPRNRREGYLRALEENDIEFRPEFDVPGNFSYEGGAEAMTQLLSVHQSPTAVFAFSDEMAIGALKTIRDSGLRVPEDVSVIGFDDHDVSNYVGLTTIHQPVAQYGDLAASILLSILSDEAPDEGFNTELPTKLVIRSTTGAAPS